MPYHEGMSPKNLPILKPFPAQPWSTPAASEPAKNWRRKHQELIDTIISTMKRDRSTEDLFEKKTSSTAAFGLSEEILYLSEADPADRELLIDWIGMAAATPIQKEGCAPVFGQGLASVLGARLMKAWAMATWDYIERPEWAKPLFHHIKLTQRHLPGLESDVAMMDMLTLSKPTTERRIRLKPLKFMKSPTIGTVIRFTPAALFSSWRGLSLIVYRPTLSRTCLNFFGTT
jgi:hypothetical protein